MAAILGKVREFVEAKEDDHSMLNSLVMILRPMELWRRT